MEYNANKVIKHSVVRFYIYDRWQWSVFKSDLKADILYHQVSFSLTWWFNMSPLSSRPNQTLDIALSEV